MRKLVLLGALILLASAALAVDAWHPLNVKYGLWETTMNNKVSGLPPVSADMQAKLAQLPPDQRARIEAMMNNMGKGMPQTHGYKSCLTADKMKTNPFSEKNCTWTNLTSTATRLVGHGTCVTGSENMKTDVTMDIEAVNSENVKGTVKMIMSNGGHSMTSEVNMTSKYVGPDCGDTK